MRPRRGMKEQFLCHFTVAGGQSRMRSCCSPVQVEGCNLCIVPLKVREVEEVSGGLLVPGLSGRRGVGGGNGYRQGQPECRLCPKPAFALCPQCHQTCGQIQSPPVALGWVVRLQNPRQDTMHPLLPTQGLASPHGLGGPAWPSWTTFFPPLEVTTPSQAAAILPQASLGKARGMGPSRSSPFRVEGAEVRQHMKHFTVPPSMVFSGCSSSPNGAVQVGYGVVPISTHFMGLKRAWP